MCAGNSAGNTPNSPQFIRPICPNSEINRALFGIFLKKNSHHMFIFHVHDDVGQQVPREMQKMGCISIVSSFVYMVYCRQAEKNYVPEIIISFFCPFCSFNIITLKTFMISIVDKSCEILNIRISILTKKHFGPGT